MKLYPSFAVVAALFTFTACTNPQPPTTPPSFTEAPPTMTEDGHATHIAERIFPVSARTTRGWIAEGRMLTLLKSTENVAKPTGYKVIQGTWPEVGSVRRIKQIDGHYLAEIVLENTDAIFTYQIYGFTGPTSESILYGRGEFEVISIDQASSKLRWTYELKPKNPLVGIFVRRFVQNDFGPFMEGGMDAMAELAKKEEASLSQ